MIKLTSLSDQLEKVLIMKVVNNLQSDKNEETAYIEESQQEMYMHEYEEACDLSCDLITNFSDIEVPEEYIEMIAAV